MTLVHEATHQLCFNTGLLSRQVAVPAWASEGLATYVERWQKKTTKIGEINGPWLVCLREAKQTDKPWIPIADLVADDKFFDDEKTAQLAYAESWLVVHYLMKGPQWQDSAATCGDSRPRRPRPSGSRMPNAILVCSRTSITMSPRYLKRISRCARRGDVWTVNRAPD